MTSDICYRCQYPRKAHAVVKSLTEDGGDLIQICPTSLFSKWDRTGPLLHERRCPDGERCAKSCGGNPCERFNIREIS